MKTEYTEKDVEEIVIGIVRDSAYDIDESTPITPDTNLFSDLGFDRLDLVEVVMAIEEKFMICIKDEDCDGIETVGDLLDAALRVIGVRE